MAVSFEFNSELRSESGKGATRRMRLTDRVPAVVYGGGEEPSHISLSHDDVLNALRNEAVFSHILKLSVGSQKQDVVLKAIQRHPSKPRILHMDFMRVRADQEIIMHVPLHFINETESPGIEAGGVLSKAMIELEVWCLPKDLPEYIEVDVSKLELGHAIHLADVKLPKGVTLAHEITEDHNPSVVSVHIPREIKEEEPVVEAAEGEEAVAAEGAEAGAEGAAPAAEGEASGEKE